MRHAIVTISPPGIDRATDAISLFKTTTMRNISNKNVADLFVPRYTAWCDGGVVEVPKG